jgi:CheY-like chemotaxis protein
LTELQGGEIGVASKYGVGSTFAFYLKSRRADSAPDGTSELLQYNTSSTSLSSISVNLDPKTWHVLIVEDNLVNQRILAQQIRKLGCTVHVANHGEEALALLRETKYYKGREDDGKDLSVILMDLEMPVMDGLTCVRRIRELEVEGLLSIRLPIIAVTANARGEQIAAAKDSGMVSLLPPLSKLWP